MKRKLQAAVVCGAAVSCGAALGAHYWQKAPLPHYWQKAPLPHDAAAPVPRRQAAAVKRSPLHLPLVKPHLVVSKERRELRLYSGEKLVRTYPVGLGANPVGDKEREGDKRTPEGDFYITTKNAHSEFYLSLGISYPNVAAADRGLRSGLITQAQYNQIVTANRRHQNPPQNTPLGGKILIHSGGSSRDWTFGCVALDRLNIQELFSAVPIGTPVTIEP